MSTAVQVQPTAAPPAPFQKLSKSGNQRRWDKVHRRLHELERENRELRKVAEGFERLYIKYKDRWSNLIGGLKAPRGE